MVANLFDPRKMAIKKSTENLLDDNTAQKV